MWQHNVWPVPEHDQLERHRQTQKYEVYLAPVGVVLVDDNLDAFKAKNFDVFVVLQLVEEFKSVFSVTVGVENV